MIYLDNAATSFPKPSSVAIAMSKYLNESAGNPGRSAHRLASQSKQMINSARRAIATLIGGSDFSRLIFTLNTTDALNMAIKGVLGAEAKKNPPHVITTVIEHNSVSRPLEALAQEGRITTCRIDCDDYGFVNPDDIKSAFTKDTALVAIAHGSNVTGAIQDVAKIGKITRDNGALFLVDAAQTIGAVPIDVNKMNIDLLAFPGHKALLGPTGTGGLYVGERVLGLEKKRIDFKPWREGGSGENSASKTQPLKLPYFLEAGTANTVGIAGLNAAIEGLDNSAIVKRFEHEKKLVNHLHNYLTSESKFTVYSADNFNNFTGSLAFNINGLACQDVAAILDDSFDIAVRSGLHCAPYIHKRLATFPDGCVRVSVGAFNSAEDIKSLIEALKQIAQTVDN